MRFLKDCQGLETLEWLTAAAIVIVFTLAVFWGIARSVDTQGSNASSGIDAIPTPPPFPGSG